MSIYIADNKLRKIQHLGHMVLDCETDSEIRTATLEYLEGFSLADASNFYMTTRRDGRWLVDDLITRGLAVDMHQAYNQHYHSWDPFREVYPHPGRSLTSDGIVDWPTYRRTEYYNDFLRPQDIHHQMNIWIPCENEISGVLALFRPQTKKEFDAEDRVLCEMLSPLLAGAFKKVLYNKRIYMMQKAAAALAEQAAFRGVLVMDERLQVICRNEEAARIIAAAKNMAEVSNGENLPIEISRTCREMNPITATEIDSRCFQIEVDQLSGPIHAEARLINLGDGSCLFFVLFGEYKFADNWAGCLKHQHVSQREMDVVRCLLDGLTNKEIGQRLFISRYTVENHLKSIYHKTGAKSRTDLIRQLITASGPQIGG